MRDGEREGGGVRLFVVDLRYGDAGDACSDNDDVGGLGELGGRAVGVEAVRLALPVGGRWVRDGQHRVVFFAGGHLERRDSATGEVSLKADVDRQILAGCSGYS